MLIEVIRPGFSTVYEPGLPEEYVPDKTDTRLIECALGVCTNCGAVEHGAETHISRDVCNVCRHRVQIYDPSRRTTDYRGTLMYHSTHYHMRP